MVQQGARDLTGRLSKEALHPKELLCSGAVQTYLDWK
jgi:hypothetical protein